jgi:hypothetical protein
MLPARLNSRGDVGIADDVQRLVADLGLKPSNNGLRWNANAAHDG